MLASFKMVELASQHTIHLIDFIIEGFDFFEESSELVVFADLSIQFTGDSLLLQRVNIIKSEESYLFFIFLGFTLKIVR